MAYNQPIWFANWELTTFAKVLIKQFLEWLFYGSQPANLVILIKNSQNSKPYHSHRFNTFTILVSKQCSACLFPMISPYSIGYDTDNTSCWITVSPYPKDVTIISSSPDPDLSDQFIHPTAEQVLQLTIQLDPKPVKQMRSIAAICQRHKLYIKVLKLCHHIQHTVQL